MALVAPSKTLLRHFRGADEYPAPDLCMGSGTYKLGTGGGEGGYQLDVLIGRDNPLVQALHACCNLPHSGK